MKRKKRGEERTRAENTEKGDTLKTPLQQV